MKKKPPTLRFHKLQSELYRTRARFPVIWCGRGSGKTEISRRRGVRELGIYHPKPFAHGDIPRFFYALPTLQQGKRVAWHHLKSLVPPEWYPKDGKYAYEADKIIKTRFGTELHLVGMDQPQRIEGNQWCGGFVDESSDQKPGVFDRSIRPALTSYEGFCWRLGVPKRFGVGAEEFKAACDQALASGTTDPDIEAYTWFSSTVVPPEELERIKRTVDPRDYREQYEASWEQVAGVIFYGFSETLNVDLSVEYDSSRPIIVGSDFNVDPMCWVLCHREKQKLVVFDEIFLRNTNTRETLDRLFERYGRHAAGWEFFGDAASKARKTSANETDYIQIVNDKRFINKRVYYFDSNPAIADRFAACNALLLNAADERRCFINPRCKRLIADLKHRSFKAGTKEPADKGDMGHMSDAWGYIIHRCFPLRVATLPKQIVIK